MGSTKTQTTIINYSNSLWLLDPFFSVQFMCCLIFISYYICIHWTLWTPHLGSSFSAIAPSPVPMESWLWLIVSERGNMGGDNVWRHIKRQHLRRLSHLSSTCCIERFSHLLVTTQPSQVAKMKSESRSLRLWSPHCSLPTSSPFQAYGRNNYQLSTWQG